MDHMPSTSLSYLHDYISWVAWLCKNDMKGSLFCLISDGWIIFHLMITIFVCLFTLFSNFPGSAQAWCDWEENTQPSVSVKSKAVTLAIANGEEGRGKHTTYTSPLFKFSGYMLLLNSYEEVVAKIYFYFAFNSANLGHFLLIITPMWFLLFAQAKIIERRRRWRRKGHRSWSVNILRNAK